MHPSTASAFDHVDTFGASTRGEIPWPQPLKKPCSRSFSRAWRASWMDRFPHWHPSSQPRSQLALTLAYFVVGCELITIAYVRYRFFASSFVVSAVEVILGGALVFAAGVLIGSS